MGSICCSKDGDCDTKCWFTDNKVRGIWFLLMIIALRFSPYIMKLFDALLDAIASKKT